MLFRNMNIFCYKSNELPEAAWEVIASSPVAVLSTVSPEGKPMSAVVYYYYDEGGNLYFLTKTDSRKFVNFQNSPQVSAIIMSSKDMRTLEIEGYVEVNTDSGDLVEAIKKIVERTKLTSHEGWLPVLQTEGVNLALIKITPERWCWTAFDKPE